MYMPFSPLHFLLFLFALGLLIAFVQFGLVTLTFHKLGLSPESAFLLLLSSLFGSAINLPLFTIRAELPPHYVPPVFHRLLRTAGMPFVGKTIIAANVGGCVIPVFFSLYLFNHNPLGVVEVVLAIAVVTTVSYAMSRPVPGLGIAMPVFVAPITAALVAMMLGGEQSPALAYISGSLGVLIGADLLRIRDVSRLGTPIASIGGAGTFDGIFITGLIAVLLS
jgi:uncharacterized membrane protein